MPLLIWVFNVANRRAGTVVGTAREPRSERCLDLLAGLPGVHFVENVEEWSQLIFAVKGVNIIIYGNIANALTGEINLRVLPGQDVISAQPGQVFRHDTVDFAIFDVINHALESGTVVVRTTPAVIC